MKLLLFLLTIVFTIVPLSTNAQDLQDVLKRGEQVFAQSCTGYCHATKGGGGGGAPRLAARGFDQAYISATVTRGISGTAMLGFGTTLSPADLSAVIAYVAVLNGIANPTTTPIVSRSSEINSPSPILSAEAARGRDLFYDATRSFSRCSTCHEVDGLGIPVADPISKMPVDVQALRSMATPLVSTLVRNGETIPALVLSKGIHGVIFYDLTTPPPVLVTAEPSTVKLSDGSSWNHASVIGAYTDAELQLILQFLRSVNQ